MNNETIKKLLCYNLIRDLGLDLSRYVMVSKPNIYTSFFSSFFEAVLRECTRFPESLDLNKSILEHGRGTNGETDFRAFFNEFLARVESKVNRNRREVA